MLILLAPIPLSHAPGSAARLPLSPSAAAFHPASLGFSNAIAGVAAATANPGYDEQIGTTFTQNLSSLTYNVTALAQTDADGYGPAYVLNGLTSAGYWYQAGISYHWPSSSGAYNPTFGFSYQVYGPNGKAVFPANGGAGLGSFSKVVHSGDNVLLSLTFSGTTVRMLAQDWNTGATASTSYTSVGASTFVGSTTRPSNALGFFTGLMTEWYHVLPYSGNEGKVTYTNRISSLSSAWLWVDEFDTSGPGGTLFMNQTQGPVTFANEQQVYSFASNGATIYSSAHEFITGLLSTASSRVMLTPAVTETAAPAFSASYTLAGLKQSAEVASGTMTVVEADPGTSVTISVNSSASSALESWEFRSGAGGSAVTFKAGANVTYVYYHLVQELVSYAVVHGSPMPSSAAPTLTYEVPPGVAAAIPSQVAVTQQLGTSPVGIFALMGSVASLDGPVLGTAGEQWAPAAQNWTVSALDSIPAPIKFFQQYRVSVGYSLIGGGTPPSPPALISTSLGSSAILPISRNGTLGWFDVGSAYSFTGVLNGSTPSERWVDSTNSSKSAIVAPDMALSEFYTHQYFADLGVNDPRGGSVSPASGWLQAGTSLHATALSNPQWQFQTWSGSGVGAYSGASPTIDVAVMGPLTEKAAFYVQLAIEADRGTSIAYSFGSETGSVQAGTTKTIYVPPSSNVTLRASPSIFVYSFASWEGNGILSDARPLLSLVVDSPTAVIGTSVYNFPAILGGAAAIVVVILAASILIRGRRSRTGLPSLGPGTTAT